MCVKSTAIYVKTLRLLEIRTVIRVYFLTYILLLNNLRDCIFSINSQSRIIFGYSDFHNILIKVTKTARDSTHDS